MLKVRNIVRAVASVLVIGSAGCASVPRSSAGNVAVKPNEATLRVANNGYADVTVYAVQSGSTLYRLGNVAGGTARVLRIPSLIAGASAGLRLAARPLAGRLYALPTVQIAAGDLVNVTIEDNPSFSNVTLAPR